LRALRAVIGLETVSAVAADQVAGDDVGGAGADPDPGAAVPFDLVERDGILVALLG
jgi:hypothetical protein